MAKRNNRLILPDFFGTKSTLDNNSIVNTTAPLQPGETIFEKDTGQFKTNLVDSTRVWNSSSYTGNAIRFEDLTALRAYEYPLPNQLFHTVSPQRFFYYDANDSSSSDNSIDIITTIEGKRYKQFSNFPFTGSAEISGSFTFSGTGSNSFFIFNLPTSDPGITGSLYTTGSDFLGGPAGKKVLMISDP
ncbi:hypothetical protein [Haliea sp.]|jgi:hypothetical protein|uniref:hypothetical protein n=1 Tax=Haliea sp. TaxID=1932666 RepID=UPI00257D19BD|nr:hypothetical protein [Haliea sp.]|tara:strand:+ start:947 stop:1510 length:564 start_codon:yes stop_codon:yes gene_type:complete